MTTINYSSSPTVLNSDTTVEDCSIVKTNNHREKSEYLIREYNIVKSYLTVQMTDNKRIRFLNPTPEKKERVKKTAVKYALQHYSSM